MVFAEFSSHGDNAQRLKIVSMLVLVRNIVICIRDSQYANTLKPEQNGRYFSITISLKCVPSDPIDNNLSIGYNPNHQQP